MTNKRKPGEVKQKVVTFLKENPKYLELPFSQFVDASKIKISNPFFYSIRNEITNKKTSSTIKKNTIKQNQLCMILYSASTGEIKKNPIKILRSFVDSLNKTGRTKLEFVQTINPERIEIREVK